MQEVVASREYCHIEHVFVIHTKYGNVGKKEEKRERKGGKQKKKSKHLEIIVYIRERADGAASQKRRASKVKEKNQKRTYNL